MRRGTKRWILWVGKLFVLVIYLVFLAYAVIAGMAFVLKLLGANPTSDFADWVYRAAANITQPFRGIFPTTTVSDRSEFDASLLFALIVYLVVAVVLHGIVDWLTRRIAGIDRAEEREQMTSALEVQRESARSALGYDPGAPVVAATTTTVPTWAGPPADAVPAATPPTLPGEPPPPIP
jgi:uncharacterized protein YggT (Ycf19 family)